MKQLWMRYLKNRIWYRRRRGEWKQFYNGMDRRCCLFRSISDRCGWTDSGRRSHILGDAGWFWIILGIVLLIPKKTRKAGIAALAALAIGALITNVALKNIIARIRPYEVVEGLKLLIEPQSDFSFPSGHTCASIGAALAMYPFLERKWGIPLVILAVLISLSRLYVGVHYPTDVLGGAVVGAFAAWGAVRIVKHGLVRKAKKAEK